MNRLIHFQNRVLGPLTAAALSFIFAATAAAQPRRAEGELSRPAYREMRRLAGELEERSRQATDMRDHDSYRLFRRDRTFVRLARDFARDASQFNARLAGYRERPSPVDDDLRVLQRSAREIQGRARSSRWADERIADEWNDIVSILDRMTRVSRSSDGRIDFGGYPGPDPGSPPPPVHERDPRDRPPAPPAPPQPPAPGRDEYGDRRNPPASGDSRALSGLARDLEQRAARAEELVSRRDDIRQPRQLQFFEAIRAFHERAAELRERVESGGADPGQVRTDADRLFEDSRRLDNDMRRSNALPEVWPEWQGIVRSAQDLVNRALTMAR